MSYITAYPNAVAADATALLVFSGPPNVRVEWSVDGTGTLDPQSEMTNAIGQAAAVYTPGTVGDAPVITVTHGT